MKENKVVIIGSGIAGMTAAIYLKRGGLEPIIIENNIVEKSWSILDHSKRYLVITDSNLLKTYDELIYQIPNLITTIALKPGELAKSIEVYQKIITALTKLGVKRNDVIIAFGGGVIGDLVGFVACTYLRVLISFKFLLPLFHKLMLQLVVNAVLTLLIKMILVHSIIHRK